MKRSALDLVVDVDNVGASADRGDASIERHHEDQSSCDLIIGELVAICATGDPIIRIPAEDGHRLARALTLVELHAEDMGRQIVIQFVRGDSTRPVVLGRLRGTRPRGATVDRVVIEADQEIVLRCGNSSLVLGRHGKVLIRGDYVVSRSTGVNRVNGASVQIN